MPRSRTSQDPPRGRRAHRRLLRDARVDTRAPRRVDIGEPLRKRGISLMDESAA